MKVFQATRKPSKENISALQNMKFLPIFIPYWLFLPAWFRIRMQNSGVNCQMLAAEHWAAPARAELTFQASFTTQITPPPPPPTERGRTPTRASHSSFRPFESFAFLGGRDLQLGKSKNLGGLQRCLGSRGRHSRGLVPTGIQVSRVVDFFSSMLPLIWLRISAWFSWFSALGERQKWRKKNGKFFISWRVGFFIRGIWRLLF